MKRKKLLCLLALILSLSLLTSIVPAAASNSDGINDEVIMVDLKDGFVEAVLAGKYDEFIKANHA